MRSRARRITLLIFVGLAAGASGLAAGVAVRDLVGSEPSNTVPSRVPVITVSPALDNEFVPVDRPLSDCISAVPRPGCGSEARGGWRQWIVALALFSGLAFVGWRIAAGIKRR